MQIALITPKGIPLGIDPAQSEYFKTYKENTVDDLLMPKYAFWSGGSLGLLIVAALTPPEFDIDFIDENYEPINFEMDYDLVGISAMTQQATRAYEIADEFRKRGVKVIIGGIHATVLPVEAKSHADSVVIGEAENTWPEFITDFLKGEIRPFYKSTKPVDLSQSPCPRYDLLKKYNYNMIWVQTTRGCPRNCDFCVASNIYGKAYRRKSISQISYEIDFIRNLWKDPLINFADDNMFVNKRFSYALVNELAQVGIRWTAQTDVSVADDDVFLKLLRISRCLILFIGFETLSEKNKLDRHGWKKTKIKHYSEIIKKIQSYGIGVLGAFIVGLDRDDRSIFKNLSDFIMNNRLYASQIAVLTPLPGTKMREQLLKENRILTDDWEKYTMRDVTYLPRQMNPEELQKGILEIYKRVYSREARMAVMRHFKEIYVNLYKQEHNMVS